MNLKTQTILAAFALAITVAAHAGPGARDPGASRPRSTAVREVTMSCPRCQHPVHAVPHLSVKPAKGYAATAARPGAPKLM